MHEVELGLFLVAALCALTLVARRLTAVPSPALLVLGGAGLALVPWVPAVEVDPELVLVVFLPPLLFFPAVTAPVRELRRNARAIVLLAFALILVTVAAVAVVARALVPGLPWAAAIALGAIVSPPDALAVTALGRRLRLPGRVLAILEGESLVNDATALIAYRVAVAAAVTGEFSPGRTALEFALGAVGAIVIGLAAGWLLSFSSRHLTGDAPLENTLFLLLPYAVWVLAEVVGVSAVLAVVVAGLYTARRTANVVSSTARLQGYAVVEVATFLLSGLAFLLIGLQVPAIVAGLDGPSPLEAVGIGLVVTAVLVAVRTVFALTSAYVPRRMSRRVREREPRPPVRNVLLVGYLGLRGVVSLAAALALPLTVDDGSPFPERDLLLTIVVTVILVTLVVQGTSVPFLVRMLGIEDSQEADRERELAGARRTAAEAALARLDELRAEEWVREDTEMRVRGLYDYRRGRFEAQEQEAGADGEGAREQRARDYQRLMRELIGAQRQAVIGLRDRGDIDDEAVRVIERELDLEEERLA